MPFAGPAHALRDAAIRLAAIAQAGLTYSRDDFDLDRYQKIRSLAIDVLAGLADIPAPELRLAMSSEAGYPTPKVDVRGAVLDGDERILMVHERADGLWSLPGGWADAGDSPSEAVVREVLEETACGPG
ncbi:MAG: NUDIX hydrolase [Acidimicrobiales bacterium]